MRRTWKLFHLTAIAAAVGGAAAAIVRAQEPLSPPAPFAQNSAPASAGRGIVTLTAAQSAHDLGLPSVAANLYREQLILARRRSGWVLAAALG